ncbi:SCAN box domain-containing protein [Trichonephila clavipes]|nr:SCAN box domain-containing protein [Trichonephila clavipes]
MASVFSRHESNRARLGRPRKTSFWPPTTPQTLQELERALLEEWDRIPQLVINSLIDSMPQRPQCDKLKNNYETVASNETVRNGTDILAPYASLGTVNGMEMPVLRDTGATLDLICKKYVQPSMFINETVWIRNPLEETAVCLPMAEVELDCVFGHVITKAAVLRDSLDQGKYLLGNKTAALFEEVKKNKEIQVYMVNAVETRSQKKLTEASKQNLNMSEETFPESNEKKKESPDELDDIFPLIQPEISESNLIKLSHKDFTKEQMKSAELTLQLDSTEFSALLERLRKRTTLNFS